jgi:threonine synthase
VVSSLKNLIKNGTIKRDEVVVAYITGNGLKTQEAVDHVVRLLPVSPTMGSFEEAMSGVNWGGRSN